MVVVVVVVVMMNDEAVMMKIGIDECDVGICKGAGGAAGRWHE